MDRCIPYIGWIVLAAAAFALPAFTANTYYLYVGASVGLLTIVTAGLSIMNPKAPQHTSDRAFAERVIDREIPRGEPPARDRCPPSARGRPPSGWVRHPTGRAP